MTGTGTWRAGITIFLKQRLNQNIAGLKESEEKYRQLFDNAVEGVFQTTPDGRFLSANPSLARILGYSSASELIEHLLDIGKQHYLNPEDRETFRRIMETAGGTSDFEVQLRKQDGSHIWVNIKARAPPSKFTCPGNTRPLKKRRQPPIQRDRFLPAMKPFCWWKMNPRFWSLLWNIFCQKFSRN
jgi:PAS domain S-box-containing protein